MQAANLLLERLDFILRLGGAQKGALLVGRRVVGDVVGLQDQSGPSADGERGTDEDRADGHLKAQHDVAEQVRAAAPHVAGQAVIRPPHTRHGQPDDEGADHEQHTADIEAEGGKVAREEVHFGDDLGKPRGQYVLHHPQGHHHGCGGREQHHQRHLGEEQAEQMAALGPMGDAQGHLAAAHQEQLYLHAQEADDGGHEDERADEVDQRLRGDDALNVLPADRRRHPGLEGKGLQPRVQFFNQLALRAPLAQHHQCRRTVEHLPVVAIHMGSEEVAVLLAEREIDRVVAEGHLVNGEVFKHIDDGQRQGPHLVGLVADGAHGVGIAKHGSGIAAADDGLARCQPFDGLSRDGRAHAGEVEVVGIDGGVGHGRLARCRVGHMKLHDVAEADAIGHGHALDALQTAVALEGTDDVAGEGRTAPVVGLVLIGLVLIGCHKAHGAGAAVVWLAVDGGERDVRHQGMGDGQRDDADGDTQYRDGGLQLVLHEVAQGDLDIVENHIPFAYHLVSNNYSLFITSAGFSLAALRICQ